MRFDDIGMFWEDIKEERVVKEKIIRTPPEPFWLEDDYLPYLAEAKAFVMPHMTELEILEAATRKDRLAWDIEVYPNYVLFGFMSIETRKVIKFAFSRGQKLPPSVVRKLTWVIQNFTLVGFNDTKFDKPILTLILAGKTTDELMEATDDLINGGDWGTGIRPQDLLRSHKLKSVYLDHIDLIELTPLGPSLKICAGRIHTKRMQDLPFPPGKELTSDQRVVLNYYWVNDLNNTADLYLRHKTAIDLREILTREYKVDVRSKSDPQIAETLIRAEIKRITGRQHFERAEIVPGRSFQYHPPAYLAFASPTMKWVLDFIRGQRFVIGEQGEPLQSQALEEFVFSINRTSYKMGIGGLHSQEKSIVYLEHPDYELSDNDVTSYYPSLILQQGMYPPNVGPVFLDVFRRFVERRVAAKDAGDKATAETLKIVTNGTFGKTGEKGGYSIVYYPEMMVQVTLSGQLSLLLLIEWLELSGIQVVSANTDGITVRCHKDKLQIKDDTIKYWERATGLRMESSKFKALYSRDVNNYIAIYDKSKPVDKDPTPFRHAKAIGAYRNTTGVYPLKWNPVTDICKEAMIEFLATGRPLEETIRECKDIRKFIEVRRVTGGAVKDREYLGKAIRWYYAVGVTGEIITAKKGHVVARSGGAKPCMELPDEMPEDIDYDFYVNRAVEMLGSFEPKKSSKKQADPVAIPVPSD